MKNHRLLFVLITLLVVCAMTQTYSAQQVPSTPGVIKIDVNLVQVDAVVTDSKGKLVRDLKAEDFEVLQDGKAQTISAFEFVNNRNPVAQSLKRLPPALVAPTSLKPEEVRRTVAIVVDDLALSVSGSYATRTAVKKWVDYDMQPGDLVSIVRTNAASGALQQLTNDKRLLYTAIDRIRYQPGRVGTSSFAPLSGRPPLGSQVVGPEASAAPVPEADAAAAEAAPATPDFSQDRGVDPTIFNDELKHAYLVGSLRAIEYVLRGLRDVPGRKSMILFSEDMGLTFLQGSGIGTTSVTTQTNEYRLRKLADEANRSSVVIYAIDPRGLINTGLNSEDNVGQFEQQEVIQAISDRESQYIGSQDGMILLTDKTGGLFFTNNDLSGSLHRAVDDGDGYYLLGYQPELSVFHEQGSRFHSIKVRVKRPGLHVRSRTGFFGTPDGMMNLPAPQTRTAQMARAMVSPFTTGDLSVKLSTLFSSPSAGSLNLTAMLHFDAEDLTLTEQPNGLRTGSIDVGMVMVNADGDLTSVADETWKIEIPSEGYATLLRNGVTYMKSFPIKKPGPYQLRVALRDATNQHLGSAMQFIDVPNLSNGRLALSGIAVASDMPTPNETPATPAFRVFKTGGSVYYRYEVLNPRSDNKTQPQLESQIRLLNDGEEVYLSAVMPLKTDAEPGTKNLTVSGRLQLTRIPPGSYVMQLLVTDKLRKDQYRVASQAIDFDVR